jgi:hypothetical protein
MQSYDKYRAPVESEIALTLCRRCVTSIAVARYTLLYKENEGSLS